jgi:hypothetical protein
MMTTEAERTIRNTRWTIASEIRMTRNIHRIMLARAIEIDAADWRLAVAYRHEAAGWLHALHSLRAVSRTLRGV